jgi:hypothetical protein
MNFLYSNPEYGYIIIAKNNSETMGSLMITYEMNLIENVLIHWI